MICRRMDLRRKIAAYVHGYLSSHLVKEIECHITQCEDCRTHLSRIQEGDRLASSLSGVTAPADSWKAIEAAIVQVPRPSAGRMPHFVKGIMGALSPLLAVIAVILLWRGTADFSREKKDAFLGSKEFRSVTLSQFPDTVEPHVVTEGYVAHISVKDEDGDSRFRLVDDLKSPNHFVVCEIIPPYKVEAPPPGSHIRVYGVSRYDGKAEHRWFEVHPVLGIEQLR